jgi:hypothetical protein
MKGLISAVAAQGCGMRYALHGRLVTVVLTTITLLVLLQTGVSVVVEASLAKAGPPPAHVAAEIGDKLRHFVAPGTARDLGTLPLTTLTTHLYFTVLLPWLALVLSITSASHLTTRGPEGRVRLAVTSALAWTLCFALALTGLQLALAGAIVRSTPVSERLAPALVSAVASTLAVLPAAAVGAFVTALVNRRIAALVLATPLLLGLRWLSPAKPAPWASFLVPATFRVQPLELHDPALLRAAVASLMSSLVIAMAASLILRLRAPQQVSQSALNHTVVSVSGATEE